MFKVSALLCAIVVSIAGVPWPSSVQRCRRSSPDFIECMSNGVISAVLASKDGNKALGIPSFDPFLVQTLVLGASKGKTLVLEQNYQNVKLYGLLNSSFSDFKCKFSEKECFWQFRAMTPVEKMVADYTMKGQLLVFPLNGQGKSLTVLYDLDALHEMKCELYEKENKKYFRTTEYKLTMSPSKVTFNFENIIPNNEELSKNVMNTMNENSLAVFNDVKPGFEASFSKIYKELLNRVFSKLSENELFLD